MCPVCIATAAIIAGSASGTGGIAAFITRKFGRKRFGESFPAISQPKEDKNGQQLDRSQSLDNPFAS